MDLGQRLRAARRQHIVSAPLPAGHPPGAVSCWPPDGIDQRTGGADRNRRGAHGLLPQGQHQRDADQRAAPLPCRSGAPAGARPQLGSVTAMRGRSSGWR